MTIIEFWTAHFISFCCVLPLGSTTCAMVTQTPSDLLKKEATSAQLQCSHSHSSYNTILWYKQTMGGGLQFQILEPDFENKNKIHFYGDSFDNKDIALEVSTLLTTDSGLYFCAAKIHNTAESLSSKQKTFPLQHIAAPHLQMGSSFSQVPLTKLF
uniref:Ig-like domain-containing protein n=1 Tax=Denticeps clupeoides TaxID=299321 RepID=A0AAY4AGL7_9TELE